MPEFKEPKPAAESLIPLHGGYRHLKSFQVAQLAFDVTVRFADRYINPRSRTHDQMVQAARSGVQTERKARRWSARCALARSEAEGD